MDITSLYNDRVKHVVKLRNDRSRRQREGVILVEGWDEINLALVSGHKPQTLFTAPELVSHQMEVASTEVVTVTRPVFEKMSFREGPDGWLALFPVPKRSLDDLKLSESPLVILTEAVEKPGNLGAILRTADAAGVDAVLACDPLVDLWNPSVIRTSRGAVFSVSTVEVDNASALAWLKSKGMQILAATPSAETIYTSVDLTRPTAIAVGAEDKGLSDFWFSHADAKVLIPMLGKVNSLNVSVSTALIVYEAVRQRSNV